MEIHNSELPSSLSSHSGAVVGLQVASFTITEDVGAIEICAAILLPSTSCPVRFKFEVTFDTISGTAGMSNVYL